MKPLLLLLLLGVSTLFAQNSTPTVPDVILKLDDLVQKNGEVPEPWRKLKSFLDEQKIPFSVGILTNSLEGNHPKYFEELKQWHAQGNIEFWNHGYDHKRWDEDGENRYEFQNSGLEHQREHLSKGQKLAAEKLGITLTAFGAPFNRTDADTAIALEGIPEITTWLYGPKTGSAGKRVLKRTPHIEMESPTSQANFDVFLEAYQTKPRGELLVLQGHPLYWDDAKFDQFSQIIRFLQKQGARFILPRDVQSQ